MSESHLDRPILLNCQWQRPTSDDKYAYSQTLDTCGGLMVPGAIHKELEEYVYMDLYTRLISGVNGRGQLAD